MNAATEQFISKFLTELREDNAAVFVGAGLSKAAGFVDWRELLDPIARPLGLDVNKEHDLVGLAQFHLNMNSGNRNELSQLLVEKFTDLPSPTENHEILARLPIRSYWTTNYDRLIEDSLKKAGRKPDAKYTTEQLALTVRGRDAVVYKMHGDVEQASDAVLTRDDYERYESKRAPFITALMGDLVERTFLFLGFSFTDPNLQHVLSRVRMNLEKNQRKHYCIAKTRSKSKSESDEEFAYDKVKQELIIQDLKRFNIETILVPDYGGVTEILRIIARRFRQMTIFISGSAAQYEPWGVRKTEEFLVRIGQILVSRDCRISSGFGLGIGSAVVTGAVQGIYSEPHRTIEGQLLLRPFPAGIQDQAERDRVFERYREELIAQAGIAIFVLGNKDEGGKIVLSEGIRKEFEIAKVQGLHLLPIGGSGSAAKELWSEVMTNFESYYPGQGEEFQRLFASLGADTDNPLEFVEPILKLVDMLNNKNAA